MSRIRCAAVSIAACATMMAVGASAAAANTISLHFFSKQVYSRIRDANGHPLPPTSGLDVGDRISNAFNDYAGNHTHHAKRATASNQVACIVTSGSTFLCDETIAIGGSMILADDFVINFPANGPTTFKITGGTGTYRHARGTVIARSFLGQPGSDLTIEIRS
jgi:hypothetical protein